MAATASRPTARQRDREAMRRLIADHGFGHAIDSIVTSVVSEVVSENDEQRMTRAARVLEASMLDSLVTFARALGWRPA
jgi:hypothetical protein